MIDVKRNDGHPVAGPVRHATRTGLDDRDGVGGFAVVTTGRAEEGVP